MKKKLLLVGLCIPLTCFSMHRSASDHYRQKHSSDFCRDVTIEKKDSERNFLEFEVKGSNFLEQYTIHRPTASYIAYCSNQRNELLFHNGSAWQRTPEQAKFTQIGNTDAASLLTPNQAARILKCHKRWDDKQKTNSETSRHRQLAALVKVGDSSLSRKEQLEALVAAGSFENSKFNYLNKIHPRLDFKDIIRAFKGWSGLKSTNEKSITMPSEELLKDAPKPLDKFGMSEIATHNMLVPVAGAIALSAPMSAGASSGSLLGPPGVMAGIAVGLAIGYTVDALLKTKNEDEIKSEGIQAPGKPTEKDGFIPKKNSNGKKVKHPKTGNSGWRDKKGNVWVPTGPGSSAHGGPHWDVIAPNGLEYDNIYPGGVIRKNRK